MAVALSNGGLFSVAAPDNGLNVRLQIWLIVASAAFMEAQLVGFLFAEIYCSSFLRSG